MFIGRLVLLLILVPSLAQAEQQRWYEVAAGAAGYLAPVKRAGPWLALSAAFKPDSEEARATFATRGTLGGFFAGSDRWAVLPMLTGDVGLRLGMLELVGTGGVEFFGFARRKEWTVFSTVGFVGGAALVLNFTQGWRLGLRSQVIWMPAFATAKLAGPEADAVSDATPDSTVAGKPRFLLLNAALFFEYLGIFEE